MKYIDLLKYPNQDPPFYLGVEQYYLRNFKEEFFLLWRCNEAVIIGRHQVLNNEVQQAYLQQHNISLFRRPSGGGAVYADQNNLMYAFIVNLDANVNQISQYLQQMANLLNQKYHLNIVRSGRNDLLLDGKKISGAAFFYYQKRLIIHGTLLYDVDLVKMGEALTPNFHKLALKGIESVTQRVTNLKGLISVPLEEIATTLATAFATKPLDQLPWAAILPYQENLSSPQFIFGKKRVYPIHHSLFFSQGSISVDILLMNKLIADLRFSGDFFNLRDLDLLINSLINIPYQKDKICAILKNVEIADYILGLSNAEFCDLIGGEET